jgi:hypothetical protein
MQHEGILVFIFLALVLLFPIAIFLRVYGVTFSGLRASGSPKKASTKSRQAAQPEQVSEKQAEQDQDTQTAK